MSAAAPTLGPRSAGATDGRQLTIALPRDEPSPSVLRLAEPLLVYPAELTGSGELRCGSLSVPALREIGTLCRAMAEAGMEDGALQVRTAGGAPVCFLPSIHEFAAGPAPEPPSPQFEMELDPC